MSKQRPTKEYELQDVQRGLSVNRNQDKPRGSSVLIAGFQTLKHIQQNDVAAERSRKTSRLSRGLDPNVPRPKNPPQGIPSTTQKNPRMRKSCKRGR